MLEPHVARIYQNLATAVEHFGHAPTNEELQSFTTADSGISGTLHYLGSAAGVAEMLLEHADELDLSDSVVAICQQELDHS